MTMILKPFGNAVLLSPFGFNAFRYDLMAGETVDTTALAEALTVVEGLATGLEKLDVPTENVRTAMALVRSDSSRGNGIQGLLGTMKLGMALEKLPRKDYLGVADTLSEDQTAMNPFDAEKAQRMREVLRFIQKREALSAQPEYSEKYKELGTVAKGGQADIRLVQRRQDEESSQFYVAWHPLETTAIGRIFDYAQALKKLDHPNIIKLVEVVRAKEGENETIVLILEVAPGESVLSYLQNHGGVSADFLEQVRDQMLDALKYAWRQGLVHRDLKPENVMIEVDAEGNPHVTLLDFALAKFMNSILSRTTSVGKGSVFYMAPEQLHYDTITEATDIHGMGLVLLDLLRGAPRRDTVEEAKPSEDIKTMAKRYIGDGALQKLILQIGEMVHPDPSVRRLAVEEEASNKGAPVHLPPNVLIPISELATESAMAMIDFRPEGLIMRWWSQFNGRFDKTKLKNVAFATGVVTLFGSILFQYGLSTGMFGAAILGSLLLTIGFAGELVIASTFFKIPSKRESVVLQALQVMGETKEDSMTASVAKKMMMTDPDTVRKIFLEWLQRGSLDHFQKSEKLIKWVLSTLVALGEKPGSSDIRDRLELMLLSSRRSPELTTLLSQALDRLDPASSPMRQVLFSEREFSSLYSQIPNTYANRDFLARVITCNSGNWATLEVQRRAILALQALPDNKIPDLNL